MVINSIVGVYIPIIRTSLLQVDDHHQYKVCRPWHMWRKQTNMIFGEVVKRAKTPLVGQPDFLGMSAFLKLHMSRSCFTIHSLGCQISPFSAGINNFSYNSNEPEIPAETTNRFVRCFMCAACLSSWPSAVRRLFLFSECMTSQLCLMSTHCYNSN